MGAESVMVWGRRFSRFMTFYPFADENSIVSSYFIVERGLFVVIYKKKEARSFEGITEKKKACARSI